MADLFAMRIIMDYAKAWSLLAHDKKFEEQREVQQKNIFPLQFEETIANIEQFKYRLRLAGQADKDFAVRRDDSFAQALEALEMVDSQGVPVYPNIATRAANILYFIITQKPFVDGNKRIAAFLFILYLTMNEHLLLSRVHVSFPHTALVSMCLLVIESSEDKKDQIIQSLVDLIDLAPMIPGY